MKQFIPYAVFMAGYSLLLLLAGLVAYWYGSNAADFSATWIAPVVAAPLALLVAMRCGRLSTLGVGVSSFALAVSFCVATVGIFIAIAIPAGLTGAQALGMFPTYFALGGWMLLLSYLLVIGAPLLWSMFFLRRPASQTPAGA